MNLDIVELLEKIRLNASKYDASVFDDAGNKGILEGIEYDMLKLLERINLFLISERGVYYGNFFMNLKYKIVFNEAIIAGIRLNTYPPVFVTNPFFLCEHSLKEIIYVVCHEIDHIIFNHPVEMTKVVSLGDRCNLERFNHAADASINDNIDFEIKERKIDYMVPLKDRITSKAIAKLYDLEKIKERESYAYYFDLVKKEGLKEEGNDIVGDSNDYENSSFSDNVVTPQNCKEINDHDWDVADESIDDIKELIKEYVKASFETISDENRDLISDRMIEQIRLNEAPPVIYWQKIFKKYIGTIPDGKRKNRAKLNRRQPHRFEISGEQRAKTIKIVVAIDTSGSMSCLDIQKVFIEIYEIIAKRKSEITVIECDEKINKIYVVKNHRDVETKITGRGGTSFTPVIKYLNSNKYFRDSMLIYFTDGFGERDIPKPMTYKNLWVVKDDVENLSLTNSYGLVVKF